MPPKSPKTGLEKHLEELEDVVTRMEQGNLSPENSLKEFERGVRLTRACQRTLRETGEHITPPMADDMAYPGNSG